VRDLGRLGDHHRVLLRVLGVGADLLVLVVRVLLRNWLLTAVRWLLLLLSEKGPRGVLILGL
jgi:hypothetical protein